MPKAEIIERAERQQKWKMKKDKKNIDCQTGDMLLFTQPLKKGGGQLDVHKEMEEIQSLQEQLAALTEITVGGTLIRMQLHHSL